VTSYASKLRSITGSEKIFFDGSFLDKFGGITRESKAMLKQLPKDTRVVTYKNQHLAIEGQIPFSKRIRQINFQAAYLKRPSFYPPKIDTSILQPQVMPIKLRGSGVRFIRLHDLFPITNPEWFPHRQNVLFRESINFEGENIFLICDSYYSQEVLLRTFPALKGRTDVLYCNTENSFPKISCGDCDGCSFDTELLYFLAVGTIEPRKNYSYLVSEIPRSWSHKLVIVGKYGWKTSSNFAANNSNVLWLQSVCDGALKGLYQHAVAYISTSLDEGFNLPAFEARNFGIPLILSDIPVHNELHSGHAKFFTTEAGKLNKILRELLITN